MRKGRGEARRNKKRVEEIRQSGPERVRVGGGKKGSGGKRREGSPQYRSSVK